MPPSPSTTHQTLPDTTLSAPTTEEKAVTIAQQIVDLQIPLKELKFTHEQFMMLAPHLEYISLVDNAFPDFSP